MSANFTPEKQNFKTICLLNMQRLTNFPYIEADFDALTNYELLSKVVEYLNKVIANEDLQNKEITDLYNAFVSLQDYINDYFDNLDVQEEINNKLDDMAESGELTEIIAQYLGLAGMITFNSVTEMKQAQNLVNGSKCATLGYRNVNDGGNAFYKIRTITNDDVVDEATIIALYDNTLIAELIIDDYIIPEQFGAYGDGEHDDYIPMNKCITYAKTNLIPIKLSKSYYISTSIELYNNDNITLFGNYIGNRGSYGEDNEIIINNNSLFIGHNLSNNSVTTVCLNFYGVRFIGKDNSEATLLKGLLLNGSIIENCQFTNLYAVLEGGFTGVSHIENCQTMNIKNFFMSDYIFTTPTDMKDIRNGTTSISSVTSFTVVTADCNNLFDNCYFNGYNPYNHVSGIEKPCFHLLYYSDSELSGSDCFLDFWYAIEESYRTDGISNAISWKDCVFQECCYFFYTGTNLYPSFAYFEFIGNELTTFGGYQTTITDPSNYSGVYLCNHDVIFNNAHILNNNFNKSENVFKVNKMNNKAITSNNFIKGKIECPLIPDSTTQYYSYLTITENRLDELNYKIYEVANVPTTVNIAGVYANTWGLYFIGRKFIFKVEDNYYLKTLIKLDDTSFMFI